MKIQLIILIALCLLLIACDGSNTIKDVNYHTGTSGITMELTNPESLEEVYEDTNFAMSLSLENLGAYDIVAEQQAIITLGFDPFFIEVVNPPTDSKITVGKSNVVVKELKMLGKSKYYPAGSKTFFYFPYLKTKKIEGQRSKPETQLFASICYPYASTLSTLVCVDFDTYQDVSRAQVCRQADQAFSSQGGPVAIQQVEVENYPVGDLVKPVFTIHIANIGDGTVMRPFDNGIDFERVCAAEDVQREDFNTLAIDAWISNNIKLICSPPTIRLLNGNGVARCEVSDEDLEKAISYRQNYQTALTINLSYVYLSTVKHDMDIKRLNPYGDAATGDPIGECETYQVSVDGRCISKCEFCTQKPNDAACQPSNAKYTISWNNDFGCACSAKTCDTLYPKGLCLPQSNYCAAASYCCSNPCANGQVRLAADGECYPKCSTSCTAAVKQCLCGTDELAGLANIGEYCTKSGQVLPDKPSCVDANKPVQEATG